MLEGAQNVTQKLLAWRGGRRDALNELLPVVYAELRQLARRQLRRGTIEDTMQSAGLVHEAYLRLVVRKTSRGAIAPTFSGLRQT